jgi:hypothetical protein
VKPCPARWGLEQRIVEHNGDLAGALARRGRAQLIDVHTPMLGDDGLPIPVLFAEDGLHLGPAGYAVWSAALVAHAPWWANGIAIRRNCLTQQPLTLLHFS